MSDQPYWLAYAAALKVNYCDSYPMFVAGVEHGRAEQRRRDAEICNAVHKKRKAAGLLGFNAIMDVREAIEKQPAAESAQPKERT